jgi:CubicO group peptidase (beta-lactamase class C family)
MLWILTALAASSLGCASEARFDTPIPAEDPWERAEPVDELEERFSAAWTYAQANGSKSLMVLQGDQVIYEVYSPEHSNETPWPMYSATKSFSCALASLAVQDGLFALEDPVSATLSDWEGVAMKEDIQFQHLLHFTSGLKTDGRALTRDGFRATEEQRVADKYAYAAAQPTQWAPGSKWEYGSVHLAAFGQALETELQRSPLAYLEERALDPIGFRYAGWNMDPDGNPMLGYGAWTSTPEMAKFGVLLRDDGLWLGERVLPEGTLEMCMQGSTANPAYGLAGWLNEEMGADVNFGAGGVNQHGEGQAFLPGGPAMYVMGGARGQRVYVIPELDWVVVQQCDSNKFRDPEFLALLLGSAQ